MAEDTPVPRLSISTVKRDIKSLVAQTYLNTRQPNKRHRGYKILYEHKHSLEEFR